MYIYPGEKTGSIKLYPESKSFYDFGRCMGGDCVRLWSHVRGCDSWQALKEIREAFGLNTPDKANSWKLIRQQEQARRQQIEAEKDAKRQWIKDVDALKAEVELLSGILSSGHCKPLSWLWCVCQNRLTTVAFMRPSPGVVSKRVPKPKARPDLTYNTADTPASTAAKELSQKMAARTE